MSDWIDVSLLLREGMTVWPGSFGIRRIRTLDRERGDAVNNSMLACDVHVGTHVDAPLHHLDEGADVPALPLGVLIGPATVARLPDVSSIDEVDLRDLGLPLGAERLLLRTRNSDRWASWDGEFDRGFVALTAAAARWLVGNGTRLIGVDGLSVQRYADGPDVHRILLEAGVVIVEGLDLRAVEPGAYQLVCLPLALAGSDGAPARAVLRRIGP